jgi:hypothetical protein
MSEVLAGRPSYVGRPLLPSWFRLRPGGLKPEGRRSGGGRNHPLVPSSMRRGITCTAGAPFHGRLRAPLQINMSEAAPELEARTCWERTRKFAGAVQPLYRTLRGRAARLPMKAHHAPMDRGHAPMDRPAPRPAPRGRRGRRGHAPWADCSAGYLSSPFQAFCRA